MTTLKTRIFWKFLFSFWITLVLFSGAAAFTVSEYLEGLETNRQSPSLYERLSRYVSEAQSVANHGGLNRLRQWEHDMDRNEAIPILILNTEGIDLFGQSVSYGALAHLKRDIKRSELSNSNPAQRRMINVSGEQYWLIPDYDNVSLGRILVRPKVIALPLLFSAFISGLMCILLTRYLITPIEKLRRAVAAYADGNRDVRVSHLLGRRRDEIAGLANDFDFMAERLNELIASQKLLLRDVSHELRSPLARLRLALELARKQSNHKIEPALNRIGTEADRLSKLIEQLLALARHDAGVQPDLENIDLGSLIEGVVKEATIEAESRKCIISLERSDSTTMVGNVNLIRSAVDNIIRNAIRYTAPESKVSVESMHSDANRNEWLIRISDRGPGVPEVMLPKLFEPFSHVTHASARDRMSGSYGLGLSIAYRAIGAHGGEITAKNREGGGLIITIKLPLTLQATSVLRSE